MLPALKSIHWYTVPINPLTPILLTAFGLVLVLFKRSRRLPLPPGPPAWPIIGHALQIPKDQGWLTFTQWVSHYGKIMHLSVFGQSIVILSKPEVVRELLEHRSNIYSDRPRLMLLGEMMRYSGGLVLCPQGEAHREGRKLMLGALGIRKLTAIQHIQETQDLALLSKLMSTPHEFRSHLRWFIASVVFEITHGYHVADLNDPLLRLAEQCNEDFSEAVAPGAFLVDTFPILRHVPAWMPGAGFKVKARQWAATAENARNTAWNTVQDQMTRGVAKPSFTADIIEQNPDMSPEKADRFKQLTYTFYAAGADTTVSAVESFFLAMSLYPEAQTRAQAEIDSVVGKGILPRFADRARLPYLDAVMKEVHRWNPVAPMALPHRLIQEDVYEGYRIPAGSTVFVNNWAMMHDPSLYPDPLDFSPDRYFRKDEIDAGLNPDPRSFAFGYGKRSCPGQSLAEDSLFIVMATVLAAFNITKAVDSAGKPVQPDVRYSGIISHAGPFDCTITPRSEEVAQMIENASVYDVIN